MEGFDALADMSNRSPRARKFSELLPRNTSLRRSVLSDQGYRPKVWTLSLQCLCDAVDRILDHFSISRQIRCAIRAAIWPKRKTPARKLVEGDFHRCERGTALIPID